jgi:hypothetical protein
MASTVIQAPTARRAGWPERLAAASGGIYVVLLLVGSGLAFGGSPSSTATANQILAYLKTNTGPKVNLGIQLVLVAFVAFVVFLAYLHRVLRDAEGPGGWLSTGALAGGLLAMAVKLGGGAAGWAAMARRDVLSPELARTLVDLDSGAFVMSWLGHGILLLAVAAVALRTGVLPRTLGWLGLVLGIGCVASVMTPSANPWPLPFLLWLPWVVAVSVVLVRRAGQPTTPAAEPTPIDN